jgi:AraC-like DNA-binding protein
MLASPAAADVGATTAPVRLSLLDSPTQLSRLISGAMDIEVRCADAALGLTVQALPEPTVVLSFQFGDPVSIERGAEVQTLRSHVSGVQHSSLRLRASGNTRSLVLKLTPQQASQVLGCPIAEFTDGHIEFRKLFGHQLASSLEDEMASAGKASSRLAIAERFVRSRLLRPAHRPVQDTLMDRAVELIVESQGQLRVAALASECGLSERQFARRFQCHTGMRPKALLRVSRLRAALHARQAGAGWVDAACEAGYADQSHWVREFRQMAGAPPQRYFGGAGAGVAPYNEALDASAFFNTRFV